MEQARWVVQLIDLYTIVVLVGIISSWFQLSPYNPVVRLTHALTEPVLAPIRKLIPPVGGIDFSPMILLVVLGVIRGMF